MAKTVEKKAKIGVLGASGYTGAELVRLLLCHPRVEIVLLTADRKAGQEVGAVFPQFAHCALPKLVAIDVGSLVHGSAIALQLTLLDVPIQGYLTDLELRGTFLERNQVSHVPGCQSYQFLAKYVNLYQHVRFTFRSHVGTIGASSRGRFQPRRFVGSAT